MGRIRQRGLKKNSIEIFRRHNSEINGYAFEEIKEFFNRNDFSFGSKKLRNRVAGYLTRIAARKDHYKVKYY